MRGLERRAAEHDELLSQREARIHDLSRRVAESLSIAADSQRERDLLQEQLDRIRGSRGWALAVRGRILRRRVLRMRARLLRRLDRLR